MAKKAPDWLHSCIQAALDEYEAKEENPAVREAKALPAGPARVRVYLKSGLRHQGLLFGTPKGKGWVAQPPVSRLAFAEAKIFFLMALDIAQLAEKAPVDRGELYGLALVYCGLWKEAQAVERLLKSAQPMPARIHKQLRAALQALFPVLSQEARFALVLHNVGIWSDAKFFARIAYEYFAHGAFSKPFVEQQRALIQKQKAMLATVLCGILCHQRLPKPYARRSILRQLKAMHLPAASEAPLQRFVWQSMHHPLPLDALLLELKGQSMRHFVLSQVFLASLLEERELSRRKLLLEGKLPSEEALSPAEHKPPALLEPGVWVPEESADGAADASADWVWVLGEMLGYTAEELAQLKLEVLAFFAQNEALIDIFWVGEGARGFGQEFLSNMGKALGIQLRQTGQASVLLAKAARGHKLSAPQKQKLKEQLIDLAKVVPALAIFAAPGGFFLLLALGKLLPLSWFPSGFQEVLEDKSPAPPKAGSRPLKSGKPSTG